LGHHHPPSAGIGHSHAALIVAFFLPILFFGMKYSTPPGSIRKNCRKSRCRSFSRYLTSGRFKVRRSSIRDLGVLMSSLIVCRSGRTSTRPDRALRVRFKMLAGRASFFTFCDELRAIDWVMSLCLTGHPPLRFLFVAGQLISSMSLMIAVVVLLARTELSPAFCRSAICTTWEITPRFGDALAYFDFSQS